MVKLDSEITFWPTKGMNHLMSVIERRELRGYGRCADTYSQE